MTLHGIAVCLWTLPLWWSFSLKANWAHREEMKHFWRAVTFAAVAVDGLLFCVINAIASIVS